MRPRALTLALSAALVAALPGPRAYAAVRAAVRPAAGAGVPVSAAAVGSLRAPTLSFAVPLPFPVLGVSPEAPAPPVSRTREASGFASHAPEARKSLSVPQRNAGPRGGPAGSAFLKKRRAQDTNGPPAPRSAALATAARALARPSAPGARLGVLRSLFHGARLRRPAGDLVPVAAGGALPRLRAFDLERWELRLPPPEASPAPPSPVDKRALAGLFLQRSIGISLFLMTQIAFVAIAVPAVGWTGYGTLMALGALATIPSGPVNGWLADRLSPRAAMSFNVLARVLLELLVPALVLLGAVNFVTLLAVSTGNFWVQNAVMTMQNAYVKRFAGAENTEAALSLFWISYLVLQVGLGLLAGMGAWVGELGPANVFLLAAAAHAVLVLPILRLTMPGGAPPGARAAFRRVLRPRWGLLLKRYGPALAAVAAAAGVHAFLWPSPIPIAAALLLLVSRTESFRALWRGQGREISLEEKEESRPAALARWRSAPRTALLYLSLTALAVHPLQFILLPKTAEVLAGPVETPAYTLLLGRLVGALFFGNLISTAAQARLPAVPLPGGRRVPGQRLVQAGVLVLAGVFSYLLLLPGSLAAAAGVSAGAAGLMALAGRLTARAWIKFFGAGLAALWAPYLFWGSAALPAAAPLYVSLLAVGLFSGPAFVALLGRFQRSFTSEVQGRMTGVYSSFSNAATAMGVGLALIAYELLDPPFPALLGAFGAVYAAVGLLFWLAPSRLPGLPSTLFRGRPVTTSTTGHK